MADARIQTPVRLTPELREAVELARGDLSLQAWLLRAVELALSTEGRHAQAQLAAKNRNTTPTPVRPRASVAPFQRGGSK